MLNIPTVLIYLKQYSGNLGNKGAEGKKEIRYQEGLTSYYYTKGVSGVLVSLF